MARLVKERGRGSKAITIKQYFSNFGLTPGPPASPENLLEMHDLAPNSGPTESESAF